MKMALFLSIQPPGCSGVQAIRYGKLLPFLESEGWQIHFVGPEPGLVSVQTEAVHDQATCCHYTNRVSGSRRYSVRKNRHPRGSLPHIWFGLLQLFYRLAESITAHDPFAYTRTGLILTALSEARRINFNLVAGICPDYQILEAALQVARILDRPFVAIYDDPHGHRDIDTFHPAEPDRQKVLLGNAAGAIFASPLTEKRYRMSGLLGKTISCFIPDSYCHTLICRSHSDSSSGERKQNVHILHLGNLGPWRPIEPFLDALLNLQRHRPDIRLHVSLYGFLYEQASMRIRSSPELLSMVGPHQPVDHEHSHSLAAEADILLVVIGPRHTDNLPSKFFDYLGHSRPILILGPTGNPLEAIIAKLGIGLYKDIQSREAIEQGLTEIITNPSAYTSGYRRNAALIRNYSSDSVARMWARSLNWILESQTRGSATSEASS